ncbi:MAG: KEOPS complex subunit Cgi121 [Nitrososphaerota archaeon]
MQYFHIMKYGEYCLILFFIKIKKIEDAEKILEEFKKVTSFQFQIFDAKALISPLQVEAAFINALLSIQAKKNIARNLALEILLKIAAEVQISNAIKKIGIKNGLEYLGIYLIGSSIKDIEKDIKKIIEKINGKLIDWKEISKNNMKDILKKYNIEEIEINSICQDKLLKPEEYLILEKVATSDLYR